jgi:eukaryotic-like serine/threonine-protein kinase
LAVTTQIDGDNRLVADRYRLIKKLGAGGMGVVWQAYDERLHRQVAVKQLLLPAGLSADEAAKAKQKIMREGRIAARLQHPHAIMVYDVTEDGGQPYLIMEYAPSRNLAEVLAERGTLPPQDVARTGADIAAALTTAHSEGVVHRDIKPGNVLLGEDGLVKITDFGISRAVEDVTGTITSAIVGTPAYLSPEVARGERASFASDVYSLGATLYAAVEGTPPYGFDDNAIALLYRVSSGQFAPPTNAGPLTDILMALLRTAPDERPTMAEASEALAAIASTADTDPALDETQLIPPDASPPALFPPIPPAPEPPPPTELEPDRPAPTDGRRTGAGQSDRRKRLTVLAAAIITLLALGAAILTLINRDQPGTAAPQPSSTAAGEPTTPQPQPPPQTQDEAGAEPRPTTSAAQRPPDDTEPPAGSQPPGTTAPPGNAPPPGNASTPQATLISYYALMPGNLQEGWTHLTPKYQASPAGGFDGYQRFWGQMSSVQISEVSPGAGGRVEATIVYDFNSGKVVRERHRYFLVSEQGRWLIDTSSVLSSVTL